MSEERHEIEVRLKDGWSPLPHSQAFGTAVQYDQERDQAWDRVTLQWQTAPLQGRRGQEGVFGKPPKLPQAVPLLDFGTVLQYVVEHFKSEDKWSLDASYGKALESGRFRREEMVCTKTLYNYVDLGLLPIKNIDLPEKLRRNTKAKKARENKKNLGRSIEERPEIVSFRTEFGHWEIDTVIGKKDEGEPCVLTLVERMTRMCIWVKARNHTAEAINEALQTVMSYFAEQKDQVFKTITGDNGSEFAGLSLIEDGKLKVYFTHPYSSCEKGTNECHNRMLRRFIPKGKSISDYSADEICFFADCINGLPRKILGYHTPEELFDRQLDRIYAA